MHPGSLASLPLAWCLKGLASGTWAVWLPKPPPQECQVWGQVTQARVSALFVQQGEQSSLRRSPAPPPHLASPVLPRELCGEEQRPSFCWILTAHLCPAHLLSKASERQVGGKGQGDRGENKRKLARRGVRPNRVSTSLSDKGRAPRPSPVRN